MTTMVERAVGWRHGLVAAVERVPSTFADLPIANFAATVQPATTTSSAGGAAPDDAAAKAAAVAEAIERYCASVCPLPESHGKATSWWLKVAMPRSARAEPREPDVLTLDEFTLHADWQRRARGFPYASGYSKAATSTDAYSLLDGRQVLVPLSLVTLDPARTVLSTSSGLAAGTSPVRAALRAVQELVERDALMATWLHSVGARRVPTELDGDPVCFDLTPHYSPHPVAAVAGNLPLRGQPRLAFGLACRSTWEDAVEKAWLEWVQGTVFAGAMRARDPGVAAEPGDVTDFDRHATFYSQRPDRWEALPIWNGPEAGAPRDADVVGAPADELRHLVATLAAAGVHTYARDLTTVDAACVGLRVVRALVPRLIPIHADHNWPFLGGSAADLAFRYPWAEPGRFPNPDPHPLG